MPGLTLDTGAMIALERRDRRTLRLVHEAQRRGDDVTVPTVVLAEWWRGQRGLGRLLDSLVIEPVSRQVAERAGEACITRSCGAVDAIVMASAAQRGDVVLTSDFSDLERLRTHFRAVPRVLRV
ncbi:MAG: type II toxin-antitoxin system VapC family toxin [Polyangiales bacterium]